MEVPRMEEQYQRNARSVANTLKEIGWKKLEGDVKSLNFWKSKAKSLEETVVRQKNDLDNLGAQGRLSLSRYQNLLASYNTLKRAHPNEDLTLKPAHIVHRPNTAGNRAMHNMAGGIGSGSGAKRPISAPVGVRTDGTAGTNTGGGDMLADGAWEDLDPNYAPSSGAEGGAHNNNNSRNHHDQSRSRSNSPNGRQSRNVFKKSLNEINADEIEKLKEIIAQRDYKIASLSRKLSHARAYPLKGINEPTRTYNAYDEEDELENGNNGTGSGGGGGNGNGGNSGGVKIGVSIVGTFQSNPFDDDQISETESFLAEENEFEKRRVAKALEIQQGYNERAVSARASNPPHIRAIRSAKSFAESVTANIPKQRR